MRDAVIDISPLDLIVLHRPVLSTSSELLRAHGGDLEELRLSIAEGFGTSSEWCEVGDELHTVTAGDAETRLRPRANTPAWDADYFHAGWSSTYAEVPADRRALMAVYVDRLHDLDVSLLQEPDLRAAAADGGASAVDRLVRRHVSRADERHAALDGLISALINPDGILPNWAQDLVHREVDDLNMTREWLTSAVVAYHHGTAGRRPDTVFGGIRYDFACGSVNLVRS
ncbi:hypothetical protein [Streptomyces sp. MBT53]|uniref:hypothetical protein n=1 Tax=Streptomyces sp. MBT53 TaxID=1488384 RepID=UPI001914A866|nr:hypothetical protein [Streptomyces sp. MBT53]MBK6017181.1 hypothetical protein [Streptomyces sp. MBT53]